MVGVDPRQRRTRARPARRARDVGRRRRLAARRRPSCPTSSSRHQRVRPRRQCAALRRGGHPGHRSDAGRASGRSWSRRCNLDEHLDAINVNMVTCGGQATIPIVHAVAAVTEVDYAEIVATVASRSAGPGTRANIDEFTRTTSRAIARSAARGRGKAIIVLNPAEPPLIMRDTIFCQLPRGRRRGRDRRSRSERCCRQRRSRTCPAID